MEILSKDLLKKKPLLGTAVSIPSPETAEVLSRCGYDWLFIDMEHGAMDVLDAQRIVQAVADRAFCVVRIPVNDPIWIKRVLDIGPAGIIVPMVNSAKEAQAAVSAAKYPPEGTRSFGVGRASGYGANAKEYLASANQNVFVSVQIEHIDAVNDIDAILQTKGLSAIFIGPFDLSGSLGKLGQIDSPEVQKAIQQVREKATRHGVPWGIFTRDAETAQFEIKQGGRFVCAGSDMTQLAATAKAAVEKAKS